jgi:hypothetical protein
VQPLKALSIVGFMCLANLSYARCQANAPDAAAQHLTPFDLSRVADQYKASVYPGSLHSLKADSDGVKRRELVLGGSPSLPPDYETYPSFSAYRLHKLVCTISGFVVAKATGSVSDISTSKDIIVTTTTFSLEQQLNVLPGEKISPTFTVVRLGGTVHDDGEILSMSVRRSVPFILGQTYLVVLDRPVSKTDDLFYSPVVDTTEVRSERITHLSNQALTYFSSGGIA